ncbi:AMP-binding protein [Pseudonocardia sp. NPDC049635]|uniref:(2,3-dihydroxybenzoyl)adenylate synthase n=1 Tax=Pseudonocardia sp. NPDC049635 TaxID=3155506 RepID=UPI0033E75A80
MGDGVAGGAIADAPTWPPEVARSYREAGYWQGRTFGEVLRAAAGAQPDHPAVVDVHHRLSYAELDTEVDRTAAGLHRLGLRRGDRVVLQLPNRASFLVVWFALQRLGVLPVHALPGHRRAEIVHLARLSEAVAYLIPDVHARFDHRTLAAEVRAEVPSLRHVVVDGDPGPDAVALEALRTTAPAEAPAAELDPPVASDVALLLLSGGTTGLPKLIPRTHDDYLYNAVAAARICRFGPESVYLAVLPVAFNFTMSCPGVLGTLATGGTVVLSGAPDPATAFALVEAERVTVTALNPPLTPIWVEEAGRTRFDLSSLELVQVGSARLADEIAPTVEPALGARLQQVFGMAEGLLNLTGLDDPDELRFTTQGRPISPADEIRVVGPDGRPVPPGEPGELLTRGPYTLRGYYRAPEHNATAFTSDGFYRTGDVVRQLPSGHLIVVGREKDQINRGGEKIAATEIEGYLLSHPQVAGVAVVAAPDERWGERTVAFVVPRDEPPGKVGLARHLRGLGVAAYKFPDQVELLDSFPLTPVGKIDKKALRARLAGGR